MATGPIKKKGPIGGRSGSVKNMNPKGITRIVKIGIRHSDIIVALIVYFERNGTTQYTHPWGGIGGDITEIDLMPNEYITSVKGYINNTDYGDKVVTSLLLETNLKVYGPYGKQVGKTFKFLAPRHGKIIGFHARSGQYLNALGVYVQGFTKKSVLCCGGGRFAKDMDFGGDIGIVDDVNTGDQPTILEKKELCGGRGGLVKDMDSKDITRIDKISIRHGDVINALTVYFEHNGTTQCTEQWGGNGGDMNEMINLKPYEYIRSVKGCVIKYPRYDGEVVSSLVLETNLNVYGPYGKKKGISFELLAPPHGQIIGFHARSGQYLNAIGVYVQTLINRKSVLCGGHGGSAKDMDLAGVTRIVKITIHHGEVIDGLTVYFERNGTTQCTEQWGGNGGSLTEINLKTNEYITSVKGSIIFNSYYGGEVVTSLLLETNLAVYGPYGVITQIGKPFELPALIGGQIIGFHARSGRYLNAIGVYVGVHV